MLLFHMMICLFIKIPGIKIFPQNKQQEVLFKSVCLYKNLYQVTTELFHFMDYLDLMLWRPDFSIWSP